MSNYWTADGSAGGWPGGWTADGWPTSGIPWTADGFVTPFTGGGGAGGGSTGGHGGGHHSGGGFHRKRRKFKPFKRLDQIVKELGAGDLQDAYEELSEAGNGEAAGSIVRAHAKSEAAIPQAATIDWDAMQKDAVATGKLMTLWHKRQIDMDDEDFWLLGE